VAYRVTTKIMSMILFPMGNLVKRILAAGESAERKIKKGTGFPAPLD
jgi:hypothetical protein